MNKEAKQKWIFAAAVVVGSCVLGAALTLAKVESNVRMIALLLWALAIIVAYAAVTLRAGRKTVAKMQEANRLFTEQHDTDAYIAALNDLLETEKGFQAQQILRINLTVAYSDKRQYQNALDALKAIPRPEKLNKPNAAFYWVNLALCNFYLGSDEEAMKIVNLQRKAFDEMRSARQTGPALAFLEIFELLHEGKQEDAAALLENARMEWESEQTAAEFAFMAEKCGVELAPLPESSTDCKIV